MSRRLALLALLVAACGDNHAGSSDGGGDGPTAQLAYFDATGPHDTFDTFWNLPWPSDERLTDGGAPDLTGFPDRRTLPILVSLESAVGDRKGWPTMPAAYFRFSVGVPARSLDDVIAPTADAPAFLVDIDATSPEVGTMYPIVATVIPKDSYTPDEGLVALAPRPGIVLRGDTKYAYVIRTAFAPGFSAAPDFVALQSDTTSAMGQSFAPLWTALDTAGVAKSDVLVATVFTTGDEVARAFARSEAIRAAYHPTIDNLALDGGNTYDGFCVLHGTITMPQFQTGTPPFNTDGRFVLDANDVPQHQADMTIPVVITIPKGTMPQAGWPLYQFFHGSGGLSTGLVDLGHSDTSADNPEPGKGPGYVVALHGLAAASSALPLNPERFPGASDYEYLNISNLAAFPETFQQGVFEQRLLADALGALHIPQATLAGCSTTATGGSHFFDPAKLVAGGQSMGGMYTNMTGALEPRWGALVPTGAGGFWNLMILESATLPGGKNLLAASLGVSDADISFVHPGMNLMGLAWEISEPIVYMSRLGHRPLPGHPVRDIYEPVGMGDTYFPSDVYDAAALSYENQEVGPQLWPTMQPALALEGLDGVADYSVHANVDGHTRVVVQYQGDGIIDPHYLYRQLDTVKHQYGCFLESFLRDGIATVPAPGGLTDPCP
ncbi:MAG TPA: hypothetical protein VGM88_09715 [Kofleriaceae bacterium]|jgi:hypothetical protein